MNYEIFNVADQTDALYEAIFDALPGSTLLVKADLPRFTIVAATARYLAGTACRRQDLLGKGFFEVFPNGHPQLSPDIDIQASFEQVISSGVPHYPAGHQYDHQNGDNCVSGNTWIASTKPVLSSAGKVVFVIFTLEENSDAGRSTHDEQNFQRIKQTNNLLMQVPYPICILKGPELVVEMANEPTLQLWGKSNEVIGLPLQVAVPELEGQPYVAMIDEVRATGLPKEIYESPVTLNRGGKEEVVYINYIYQPYYEEDNAAPVGVLAVGQEVTRQVEARNHAHDRLVRAHEQLALILESTTDAFYSLDAGFHFTYVNQRAAQLWQRDRDLLIGKHYWSEFPDAVGSESYNKHYEALREGKPVHYETVSPLVHIWIDASIYPGSNGSLSVFFRDITSRKQAQQALQQSESKLRNMILQAPVAMCIFRGKDYVVEIANERMLQIWGKSAAEVVGKPTFEANPEGRDQGFEEILATIMRTGEAFHVKEIPLTLLRYGKPERFYTSVSYDPIKELDGTVSGILVVGIEVTEQVLARKKIEEVVAERTDELRKANEALVRSNHELLRSNTNLEEFAHAASHDLKEPIRKVMTFSERLKTSLETRMNEAEKQLFERVENATRRMGLLVDDLLEFSHVSERPLEKENVDLNKKLDQVLMDLELMIEQKQAKITTANLPVVKGYRRQLQQLFHNLISNAIKYSKPGQHPDVFISSGIVSGAHFGSRILPAHREKSFYLIEVRDNGIGFEPQYSDRIFSMFQRLHGKSEYPGTGVGLSIARKVVENHSGYIWAKSQSGQGATFSVLLPIS